MGGGQRNWDGDCREAHGQQSSNAKVIKSTSARLN